MFPTKMHEKEKVKERISSGEIAIGNEVVQPSYNKYSINPDTQAIQLNRVSFSARKIPINQIRERLLQKHEELGVIRKNSDDYYALLSEEEIKRYFDVFSIPHNNSDDICQKLKYACRTRHLKIWHDHSTIAAHGYLLILISVIYDPAFYYTTDEMKTHMGVNIDVPALIEKPEVHIIARSSSSTEEQLLFVQTRRE